LDFFAQKTLHQWKSNKLAPHCQCTLRKNSRSQELLATKFLFAPPNLPLFLGSGQGTAPFFHFTRTCAAYFLYLLLNFRFVSGISACWMNCLKKISNLWMFFCELRGNVLFSSYFLFFIS